ncbi:hypothetical protein HPB47_024199 [Ixodes persulcatus]|uniref:Uncharacterized protein n=1 Tax=Ixodes persulcatus TaxID=34615 RepID=A0AC60Q7A6_IXOPE|nr:hypothetical protein HPB47_024199 [Ixodes persulcatus]
MEDIEKDCLLFLDEMEIMQGYEHGRSEDCLFGGVTLPDRPKDAAHRALVFMVGGPNRRWKQVIAYDLTGRSVDGSLLKDFVFELVQLCSEISPSVLVVTRDMGSANRVVWDFPATGTPKPLLQSLTLNWKGENFSSWQILPMF